MKLHTARAGQALRATLAQTRSIRSRIKGFGSGRVCSGSGIGTVLVLASLALTFGRAAASDSNWSGSIHIDDLLNPGRSELLVEVPRDGLRIDLWSDPEAGSRVRVGQKGRIYFESNADCYVTILSVDTEGRTSRLFPRQREDGWVWGGETYRLPDYGSHTDLRFSGPEGVERVFAIASLSPQRGYYPSWLERGRASNWARANSTNGSAFFETGWLFGDPLYELRELATRLVSSPQNWDTYNTAWVTFYVGHSHYRRPVRACSLCGGLLQTGHAGCGGGYVTVELEPDFGWIDFSVVVLPRYHYRACRTWRPSLWVRVFHDPYPDWRWCDWRISHRGHGKGRVYTYGHHGWHEPHGRWRDRVEYRQEKVRRHYSGEAWGRKARKGQKIENRRELRSVEAPAKVRDRRHGRGDRKVTDNRGAEKRSVEKRSAKKRLEERPPATKQLIEKRNERSGHRDRSEKSSRETRQKSKKPRVKNR